MRRDYLCWMALLAAAGLLGACASTPRLEHHALARAGELRGTMKPYQVGGCWYVPAVQPHYDETGIASWYGPGHDGHATADGEIFDMWNPSAAHKTLPLPSLVEVTNLDNGKRLRVRVNDRGPFVDGRIIDLSRAAADQLGFSGKGTARVRVRYVGPASGAPDRSPARLAPGD